MDNQQQIGGLVEKVAEEINWYSQACPYIDWNVKGGDEVRNYRREHAKQILFNNNLAQRVKCPECGWSQVQGDESVTMMPCYNCNSTGYIYTPLKEME